MKRLRILTLFVFTLFINSLVAQTNFYYSGTGNGDDITNWWTNSNGTGSNPSNFTTINQVFRVQTGQNLSSFTGIWTVSGTNSKVVIENGGTLTGGSFNHVIKLDMEDNANYIASSSYTGLNFQSINANSNFKLNSTNLRTSLVYPNLIIDNNIIINPGSASLTINGNLQINSGSEFRGTATQTPTHTIGGNVIVQSGGIWTLSFGSTGVPIYNISGTISNLGTINAPSANGLSTINLVGSNSVTVNWGTKTGDKHNLTIASTKTIIFGDNLAVSSGTITADGIIDLNSKTISGAGSFTLSAGATLKTTNTGGINGSVSCSSKSFSTSANYIFNGTSAQIASTDLPATINSLTISNTSGLSLSANLAVTGSVTNTGILDAVTYTLSYGSISNSGATLRFSGVSNGFALNSGTIEYYGATQTIKNGNYSTLNITVAGNKTADGNITATTMDNGGNTNLASILDMAAYTFSVTTLDNAGATIKFSAATNAIAVSSGTIEYSGTTQTITSGTYNNLTISGTGTKTLAGSIIINNALTIGTGTDLNTSGSAYNIMVGNNWINNGSFTANSGTTTFNGTTTIMGSTSSFNNVTITGILTGSSSNMNVAGNWINNGTFNNNGGTVTFSGTTTISGSSSNTFKNIIITGSLTPPVSGINVAGDFTNNGTFNHNNGLV
ncbi:MAG TPA: hypothetical protein VK590_04630, partial [Saprospiraceae bacterium]|nr:hypothetical protein [Saprospiraceae bacterium]